MNVLKAPKTKVFGGFPGRLGIVERRHTVPHFGQRLDSQDGPRRAAHHHQRWKSKFAPPLNSVAMPVSSPPRWARKLIDILKTVPGEQTVSLEGRNRWCSRPRRQEPLYVANPASARFPAGARVARFWPPPACRKTLKHLLGQVSFAMAVRHSLLPQRHSFVAEGFPEPGRHRWPPPGLWQCRAGCRGAASRGHLAAQRRYWSCSACSATVTSPSACNLRPTRPSSALPGWNLSPLVEASSPTTTASSRATTKTRSRWAACAAGQLAAHGHHDQRQVQRRALDD